MLLSISMTPHPQLICELQPLSLYHTSVPDVSYQVKLCPVQNLNQHGSEPEGTYYDIILKSQLNSCYDIIIPKNIPISSEVTIFYVCNKDLFG